MTRSLKLSLAANAALCAALIVLVRRPLQSSDLPPAPAPVATQSSQSVSENPAPAPQPFNWRQLESTDYRAYIANLRRVGCPEQTVRDIIAADVDSLYAARRQQLQNRFRPSDASPWDVLDPSQSALTAELQKLHTEELNLISSLLGLQPSDQPLADNQTPVASPHSQHNQTQAGVSVPLALQSTNAAGVNLSDDQLKVLSEIRESFITAVGGPNQNPDDPGYRKRWQKAQPESDDMLRGMLGIQTWLDLESDSSNR